MTNFRDCGVLLHWRMPFPPSPRPQRPSWRRLRATATLLPSFVCRVRSRFVVLCHTLFFFFFFFRNSASRRSSERASSEGMRQHYHRPAALQIKWSPAQSVPELNLPALLFIVQFSSVRCRLFSLQCNIFRISRMCVCMCSHMASVISI